ncbi:MAG: thioredoxin family protein [Vampirovibrionales bacterium]|jgi:thiol-disulfide isomerase/thioredoxin|nr:thioredoxin family protein [Vampirovibrionales bacterium]
MPSSRFLFKISPKKIDFVGLFSMVLALFWIVSVTLLNEKSQADGDQMVVFTAQWCASCSTLVPSIQGVSARLGIPFTKIDVDDTRATAQARQFGLTIPRADLPQAYYIQSGKQTLVLNGKQYTPNQAKQVDADVTTQVNRLR